MNNIQTQQTGQFIRELRVDSPEATAAFVEEFIEHLEWGDTLAFYGNLGSGKTFFIQHLCKMLHIEETPTSPTFTIVNEYHPPGGQQIYHFDFYRLTHEAELANLGLEDYFYSGSLCLIEWAEKIQAYLPIPRYDIYLDFVDNAPQARQISIYRHH